MPIRDLSDVTVVLQRLLAQYADHVEGVAAPTFGARPESADELDEMDLERTYGVHLHHVEETATSRRMSEAPVSLVPVGVRLRYVVTAHHRVNGQRAPLVEQKLIGYAVKAIHDHPVVLRTSQISGAASLLFTGTELELGDVELEFALGRPDPEQAAAFWNGSSKVPRPAVFIEVAGTELAPERRRRMENIVLSVGRYYRQSGAPVLRGTESVVEVKLPTSAGGAIHTLETSPARVARTSLPAAGDPPAVPPSVSRLVLFGEGLGGTERRLELVGPREDRFTLDLDPTPGERRADSFWSVRSTDTAVELYVHDRIYDLEAGAERALPPGHYRARLIARSGPVEVTSNQIGFSIAPAIRSVSHVAGRRWRVELDSDGFARPPPPAAGQTADLAIELGIGGVAIPDWYVVSPLGPGGRPDPAADQSAYDREAAALVVMSAANDALDGLAGGTPAEVPIRLLVDGAESPPFWVEGP